MTDYTAIQEFLTRVMKWKTFQWNISPSLWHLTFKDVGRNKRSIFSHVQFLIRQFSYDGTISRFNRLRFHNKKIFCLKKFMQPPQFLR